MAKGWSETSQSLVNFVDNPRVTKDIAYQAISGRQFQVYDVNHTPLNVVIINKEDWCEIFQLLDQENDRKGQILHINLLQDAVWRCLLIIRHAIISNEHDCVRLNIGLQNEV